MLLKKSLQQVPFFLLLLPVFFVLHGFNEDYYYINFSDCLYLMAQYAGWALLLFMAAFLLIKRSVGAALFSSLLLFFYLFFGALHTFLKRLSLPHRHSIVLFLFLLLLFLLVRAVRKKKSLARVCFFFNVLLLLYLVIDAGSALLKAAGQNRPQLPSYSIPELAKPCDSCARPDIYFLVFDEYSSSRVLKDFYHYDNSELDHFLESEDFSIQKKSIANYSRTPFSIASMLNFSYLKGLPASNLIGLEDFKRISLSIQNSEALKLLSRQGYRIVNLSFFALADQPPPLEQLFISMNTRLITGQTFSHYYDSEFRELIQKWLADKHLRDPSKVVQSNFTKVYEGNTRMLALAKEESAKRPAQPRFVYVHVFMPHWPHLFDSLGRRKNNNLWAGAMNDSIIREYTGYLPYTNACAKDLISTIKKNSGGKAVILFMSDHGFRFSNDQVPLVNAFFNQNAVYFPDKDYHLLYDSISGVNQFRVVFNHLFHQNLPLLKDSVLFLKEKQ